MRLNLGQAIAFSYTFFYPIGWSIATIILSGDLGSFENTQYFIGWFISWFTIPSPAKLTDITRYARKFGHVFFYGIQFVLWFIAILDYWGLKRRSAALYSLGLCLILALVDEGRQSFYPARGSSLWDISLDMGGAILAAVLLLVIWNPKFSEQEAHSAKTRLL